MFVFFHKPQDKTVKQTSDFCCSLHVTTVNGKYQITYNKLKNIYAININVLNMETYKRVDKIIAYALTCLLFSANSLT